MTENQPSSPTTPKPSTSGKAVAALVLGILSIIGFGILTGIPAYFIGRSEEKAIKRGEASKEGEIFAKIGWILGLISIILSCVVILILAAVFGLGFGIFLHHRPISDPTPYSMLTRVLPSFF